MDHYAAQFMILFPPPPPHTYLTISSNVSDKSSSQNLLTTFMSFNTEARGDTFWDAGWI
jgi:hypothetical protein